MIDVFLYLNLNDSPSQNGKNNYLITEGYENTTKPCNNFLTWRNSVTLQQLKIKNQVEFIYACFYLQAAIAHGIVAIILYLLVFHLVLFIVSVSVLRYYFASSIIIHLFSFFLFQSPYGIILYQLVSHL